MKVLISPNRQAGTHVLLFLEKDTKTEEIRGILRYRSRDRAIKKLITKASHVCQISSHVISKPSLAPNFFISHDYTSERLI